MRREWQVSDLERGTEKVPSVRMVEAKPVVLKKSFFQAGAFFHQQTRPAIISGLESVAPAIQARRWAAWGRMPGGPPEFSKSRLGGYLPLAVALVRRRLLYT